MRIRKSGIYFIDLTPLQDIFRMAYKKSTKKLNYFALSFITLVNSFQ